MSPKKHTIKYVLVAMACILVGGWLGYVYIHNDPEQKQVQASEKEIDPTEQFLDERETALENTTSTDPFGSDDIVQILLVGLDSRAGQTAGHCDVIQFFEINRKTGKIQITAVPRGTFSPLPGTGHASSSYYVSNACGIGGLDYGIKQIERILGKKADYRVVVGFSETLGILRHLKLPTTETLQWLRQRQGYAIGEPQRAHNHSTFLKNILIKFTPETHSGFDIPFEYIVYKTVKTDLTFAETRSIIGALIDMNIREHPDNITLAMRPWYPVQDIPYNPDEAGEYTSQMLSPIKQWLSKEDYANVSVDTIQEHLLKIINEKQNDPMFIDWAFENDLWLQIEDQEKRAEIQYDFTMHYIATLSDLDERKNHIADYILEMEYLGWHDWAEKGRLFLEEELIIKA